ncbi:unnamed protein product [Microthlaspi erraticum]|uniref:Aspartic peptidase DDI1-type domain-containing protein n=1 Tax=Microthlaspi erraticum TaxID=1685480 RepID=A0A6D2K7I2_9BRAS|nr:unnamed protein product [Microthlaspi erraticum]
MTKTVDEAKVLIENLAASDCNNCPDYDRSSRTTTSSPDSFQMTELKNMMAQVLKGQLKHINAIEGMSDANEDSSRECMGDFSNEANEEDVNYIGNYGNKGYNPSYRPNPNMSYRNPNVENPQDQVYPPRYPQQQRPPYQSQGSQFQPRQGYEQRSSYPPKEPYASSPNQAPPNQQGGRFEGILQQIMDGQKRNTKEMYEKMDTLFSNLNTKYDAVATHVKKLETQVTQTMEAVKRQEAESKKSFCNSAAIEERFEDQVPEWMLSKPTVDCMIWPEENYPERESNRARKRRLFPKIIPKTDNSGKFVVPCIIKGNILEQSLCDTGANVNIMSKRIADKIGLTKIEPSSISINYADSFSQTPYGFVPNVMVQIGNCSIPTDFQIVEMRESSHRPLIFGTPFLSTVGAIFDFPNQRISFNKVNKGMFFPMCSTKNSFVDMVQEEKATLKPPQEGETEETIKEDPIPKPKQLAKQARSKTKAPTPKPPKGSTKIEDEAKPRRRLESLEILAEQFQSGRPSRSSREGIAVLGRIIYLRDRKRSRHARTNRERLGRDRPNFRIERTISRDRPNAQSGWPRNDVPLGQNIRPTEVSAKVQTIGRSHSTTRETLPAVGQASNVHATPRAGNKASRPRNPFRVPRPMHPSEPGKNVPRPAENHRPNLNPLDHAGRPNPSDPDRSDSPTIRLSGRSSRTTVPTPRSTRSPF